MNPTKYKERMKQVKEQIPNPLLAENRLSMRDSNRKEKPCGVCKKPMLVAKGQIAKFHKKCRKLRHNKSLKK